MHNLALNHLKEEPRLGLGKITEKSGEEFTVSTDYGDAPARRAAGCLLEPEPGDRVLIVWTGDCEVFVLNVLMRDDMNSAALAVPGDLSIKAGGTMNLSAETIGMNGGESVQVRTSNVELSALKGAARLGSLRFFGGTVSNRVGSMKTVAGALETVAERVIDRLGRRYTRVSEFEDVQSGRIRMLVKDFFTIRSRSTSIKSKDRVEMDADQILLG